jgi:hypothetical protein
VAVPPGSRVRAVAFASPSLEAVDAATAVPPRTVVALDEALWEFVAAEKASAVPARPEFAVDCASPFVPIAWAREKPSPMAVAITFEASPDDEARAPTSPKPVRALASAVPPEEEA